MYSSLCGARLPTCPKVAPVASRRTFVVKAAKVADAASVDVKKLDGSSAGSASVAFKVADESTATGVVHRYLVTVRQNARAGTASTLTRSEVRGGGKKPFAQKGTGNARRGTRRSPLMPGGAVVFGPKPRDWSVDMNKKEKRLAMATALQSAAKDNMIVVEDMASWSEMKTKSLVESLTKMGANPMEEAVYVVVGDYNEALFRSGTNVQYLAMATVDNLNVYDVLRANKVVVDRAALAIMQERFC